MKKIYYLFILAWGLYSCASEHFDQIAGETESTKGLTDQNEEIVQLVINGDSITVNKKDGLYIFEGDIIIHESQLTSSTRSATLPLNSQKWTNNIVFYKFDDTINSTDQAIILDAMKHWQENSHLFFLPAGTQKKYINFFIGTGNWSYIGMIGGKQNLSLARNDYNKGIVIHEIGHALGLLHEHTRIDRDKYVKINWENIEEGKEHNFKMYTWGVDVGDFDFNSIMLYSSYSFSKTGLPTLTTLDGKTFTAQRKGLSEGDIAGILLRYPHIERLNGIAVPADYDGDGKIDLSIKTDDGRWYIDYARNGLGKWDWVGLEYGDITAIPVPADYDGDGKTDLSVKTSDGKWCIDYARNGFGAWDWTGFGYGTSKAIPVPADYDGDGKADLSVKTNLGKWSIDYASNGFGSWDWTGSGYGGSTYIPVPADYDGDGKADLSVKTSLGKWCIDYASNGFKKWDWTGFGYGGSTYIPVPADYDGDGKADLSVKANDGTWYIDYAVNGFKKWDWKAKGYGASTSIPIPADYDGDGKADLSVRTDFGEWCVDYAVNGFEIWDWKASPF